jgi:ABC-2 type transport system ATP-binding protein
VIKIENMTKMFGQTVAVKNISFEVQKGEILGFLGPNGAGKTTTMRVLTGYFPPTDGNAQVAGYSVLEQPLEVKKRIGYVPENPSMYNDMRVRDYLRFIGAVKGIVRGGLKAAVEKAVEECALSSVEGRRIGELSKGFRQRVALGQAVVNDPPVLVLDEPTSGLDPKQIHEIRSLIKSMAGERTIILSTHILPEVSMTCSKVVIINEGEIVAVDETENLGSGLTESHRIELEVEGEGEKVRAEVLKLGGVKGVEGEGGRYVVEVEKEKDVRAELARVVVGAGFGLLGMRVKSMSLEDVFLRLVTEEEGVRR